MRRLWRDESGATIVEHAIMTCAVALVVVVFVASDLTPSRAFQGVGYIAESLFAGEDLNHPSPSKGGID